MHLPITTRRSVWDPDNATAYSNRGNAKVRLGQHEDAIADCDQAIHLDSNDANAYGNRGNAKAQLGRHEDAIGRLRPGDPSGPG